MTREKPFFSIVIPTYERPEDLTKCLISLSRKNQAEAPTYEIIVTDDSRTNESKKLVERDFPNVFWGKGKQNGPAGNRNAGVDRAIGEWIVFIDDDCIAENNYLMAYEHAIKANPGTLIFEGKISADRERKTWAEGCPQNTHGGMFWTSNLCVKKDLFLKLGSLDEQFRVAYEDVEFAYRIAQNKLITRFVPEAAVIHTWRSLKGKKNWKQKNYEIESLLLFLEKHPDSVKEYGNPKIFLKNILRMLTSDIYFCVFKLKARGLDELTRQLWVSIRIFIKLLNKRING